MTRALGLPSPGTPCVARSHSGQARQSSIALLNSSNVLPAKRRPAISPFFLAAMAVWGATSTCACAAAQLLFSPIAKLRHADTATVTGYEARCSHISMARREKTDDKKVSWILHTDKP